MSIKTQVSILTILMMAILFWLVKDSIFEAWQVAKNANLLILSLTFPMILLSYYAGSESVMSYLRKTTNTKNISKIDEMKIMLESNFVNHVLPSGGASGMSYMAWRLKTKKVPLSKATMSQAVRMFANFIAFAGMIFVALIFAYIDIYINFWTILVSLGMLFGLIFFIWSLVFLLKNKKRIKWFCKNLVLFMNKVVSFFTFSKVKSKFRSDRFLEFMLEVHDDYRHLRKKPKLLILPIVWSVVFYLADVLTFYVVFWSLGDMINPALILLGYGLGFLAAFLFVTPGGSGAYEVFMAGFLIVAGVSSGVSVAGVVLSRVIILLVILLLGYVFYQKAILEHKKVKK